MDLELFILRLCWSRYLRNPIPPFEQSGTAYLYTPSHDGKSRQDSVFQSWISPFHI